MTTANLQRILLVDDEADLRMVAKLALESLGGFKLELCESGEQALEKAPVFAPDLILLDVSLPGMDGPETLHTMRRQPQLADIPVVFMTAMAQPERVQEYKAAGALDVIAKPFEVLRLPNMLKEMWARHQAARRSEAPPGDAIAPDVQDQLNELRRSYVKNLPDRLSLIETVWQECCRQGQNSKKLAEMCMLIHQLSGSGATFDIPALSSSARALETLLRQLIDHKIEIAVAHHDQVHKYLKMLQQASRDAVANLALQAPMTKPAPVSATKTEAVGPLIFVVEDDLPVAQNLSLRLANAGYRVQILQDPTLLPTAVQQTAPDVLIMDILFPQGSGTQIVADLQQQREKPLPVIFISASDDINTRLQAVRAGGYAYLHKPVDVAELLDKLALLTGRKSAEAYRILVVDDEPELASYHALILRQHNMVSEIVHDPLRVLDALVQFRPDLVLLDLNMPACNGIELATVIRQQKDYANIPIVFLTAEKNPERYMEAMLVGANDFLRKPIEPVHLVLTLTNHLHRLRTIYQQQEEQIKLQEDARKETEAAKIALEARVNKLEGEIATARLMSYDGELVAGTALPGSEGENYVIERTLGRGGMGVTYLARRQTDRTPVVLKTLQPSGMSDVKVLMRFVQEARTLLTLRHENLVRGYDFYQSRNFCYLAMDFVRGYSVEELLTKRPRLDPLEATRIVLGIARGLAYLEEQGLVHRDIKPANIIVSTEGIPKLVDFGIAKMTDRDCSLTTKGIILGTPYYLSPEQAYEPNVDIRSDIYSLGASYYHMVVGCYPFTGDTMMDVLQKRFQQVPKPCQANPYLSKRIGQQIERMMQIKKERRPQHARELIAELELVIASFVSPPLEERPTEKF